MNLDIFTNLTMCLDFVINELAFNLPGISVIHYFVQDVKTIRNKSIFSSDHFR